MADRYGRTRAVPFWPIDFTRLDIEVPEGLSEDDAFDAVYAARNAAIATHFALPQLTLWPDAAFAGPPIPDWWRCAIHVADSLDVAVKNAPAALQSEEHMLVYAQGKLDDAQGQGADAASAIPVAIVDMRVNCHLPKR